MLLHREGTFLAAAVSVAAATTLRSNLVGGTGFTNAKMIDATSLETIAVTIEATAAAAPVTGSIFVDFVVACQSEDPLFDTANNASQIFTTIELVMSAAAAERMSRNITLEGFSYIGIGRLRNSDVAEDATVQVYWAKHLRFA